MSVVDAVHFPVEQPLEAPREQIVETPARNLCAGDRLVQEGFVALTFTDVASAEVCGFVSVPYRCAAAHGTRVFPAEQILQIRRPVQTEVH